MDNRQNLEEAISKIKNDYIIESLEYCEEKKTKQSGVNFVAKAAVAVLVVGVFGTASAIAAANYYKLKNVTIDENVIYFGEYDKTANNEKNESDHIIDLDKPVSAKYEQDDSDKELWLDKSVDTFEDGETVTKYSFANYEDAVAFLELDSNFSDLPGTVEFVRVMDRSIGNAEELRSATIMSGYQMKSGSYKMVEFYVAGAVDENAYMVADLYETSNERAYVNKNGVEFTLVDGYETENEDSGEKITKVLLGCDHYFAMISFEKMNEEDIYSVLDCFSVNYVAPE